MTFEFRLPILPQASFFSNVKLAALSLAKLGGDYATAPLKVSVGGYTDEATVLATNRWSARYPVVWRVVPREISNIGFAADDDRYVYEADSEIVILMDADACLVRPVDHLLYKLRDAKRPTVAGMQAHFPPFREWSTSESQWRNLLAAEGYSNSDVPLDFSYSMISAETTGHCPAYFNYGFVAFNKAGFEHIRPLIPANIDRAVELLEGTPAVFFASQIGLAFSIIEAQLDVISLGPEYNCPNSNEMLAHGLADATDARVIHFLRTENFDRHSFLCQREAFDAFRTGSFDSPIIQLFQRHVLSLNDVFYDEPQPSG